MNGGLVVEKCYRPSGVENLKTPLFSPIAFHFSETLGWKSSWGNHRSNEELPDKCGRQIQKVYLDVYMGSQDILRILSLDLF